MVAIQVYQQFVVNVDGHVVRGGSLAQPRTVDLGDGEIADQTFKVGAGTIVKVWDKSENEALGDFDFLWVEADLDVELQLTTDAGSSDGYFVVELKGSGVANRFGPALCLASDLAHQTDGSVDLFDGTEDTIDEIWVKNPSTSSDARVRVVVAT